MKNYVGKFYKFFKDFLSSFQIRIFIMVFLASVIPLISSMFFLYYKSVYSLMKQTTDIARSTINMEVKITDNAFCYMDYWSNQIIADPDIIAICQNSEKWGYPEEIKAYGKTQDILKKYILLLKKYDVTFDLYLCNRNMVFDSSTTYYHNANIFSTYQSYKDWVSTENVFNMGLEHVVTKSYNIVDSHGKVIGVLAANVSNTFFDNYPNEIEHGLSGETFIVDRNNSLILSSNNELFQRFHCAGTNGGNLKEIELDQKKYLLVSGSLDDIDSVIYVLVPTNTILGNIENLKKIYLILTIITILFVVLVSDIITKIFYKPIGILKKNMYSVEQGNLNTKISEVRHDNLQNIFNSFNSMTEKLGDLVHEVSMEKMLNEEAELKLLQAQINPHFLYNTFDSIYSIAKLNKVDQIANMVAALSRFFRISLSGGKNIVTMKEAVEIAESYLIIQNIRFMNKIQYSIEVEKTLWNMKVPKLIFQPIVENAVYHGLERKKGKGTIWIKAAAQENHVLITIEDDGVGIKAKKLAEIERSLYSESVDSKYYALCNLARQLKLLYKENYSFNIESECGVGTRVTIRLPKNYDLKEMETACGRTAQRDQTHFSF